VTTRAAHRREARKGVVLLASALIIGLVAGGATWSAFNATTTTSGNTYSTGTVSITDNDAGVAMFNVASMRPGVPVSACIKVTYTGSLTAGVKLYGATTGGTGLQAYLQMVVTRGTMSSGAFPNCTSFTPDPTDYTGLGAGIISSGLLSVFPATQATGVTDPNATWATNESHWYMITVDVQDAAAAEGKSATETFTWDAR
jgi:predicted ribosomally synthesized peptide with SipW-like signal peptide